MFTREIARQTSRIIFQHTDGTTQGGAVSSTMPDTFSVCSAPRYGDTRSHTFRYQDVAEILELEERWPNGKRLSLPSLAG